MKACFVIDDLSGLKPYKDTSLDLMLAGLRRSVEIDVCGFTDFSALEGEVLASAHPLRVVGDVGAATERFFEVTAVGAKRQVSAADYDVIFIRKDPPFDSDYFSLTLLLSPLEGRVTFVNSPQGLRNVSEKLSTLNFARYAPRTLISYSQDEIGRFAAAHDQVVLKASYFGSGKGVFISSAAAPDFSAILDQILALEPKGPVIAQEFLPEVHAGDTRVMMLNGEPVAALGRKPDEHDFRANIAAGGTPFAVELSDVQRACAREIGAYLRSEKIIFAGIDFIGDKLIEINVTSPTLIQELRQVGGPDVSAMIWDSLGA